MGGKQYYTVRHPFIPLTHLELQRYFWDQEFWAAENCGRKFMSEPRPMFTQTITSYLRIVAAAKSGVLLPTMKAIGLPSPISLKVYCKSGISPKVFPTFLLIKHLAH